VKSPDYKVGRAVAAALYPAGDPARRTATPETAGAVTLDDVKSYYASTYRPDLTTIVVIGDVTAGARAQRDRERVRRLESRRADAQRLSARGSAEQGVRRPTIPGHRPHPSPRSG
jgi:hypothetical protein